MNSLGSLNEPQMSVTISLKILTLFALSSCVDQPKVEVKMDVELPDSIISIVDSALIDTNKCGLVFKPNSDYATSKKAVINTKAELLIQYNKCKTEWRKRAKLDSIGDVFSQLLLEQIIPHWYGTEWDFNGYTAVPNEGVIACGYFVSTTLRDMGLKLNRYRFAQKDGYNAGKSIAFEPENQFTLQRTKYKSIDEMLETLESGLYFVGLDHHVGYLFYNESGTYFIHSNFIEDQVMAEKAKYSPAFESSLYVFTKISGNNSLMLKWLNNEEI